MSNVRIPNVGHSSSPPPPSSQKANCAPHESAALLAQMKPSINWLLVLIPVAFLLDRAHAAPPLIFFSAAIAIVPIASLIVHSTEQISTRTGDAIGGLLNA